jgi:alpha-mannosidase
METVEPNLKGNYVFDYAILDDGKFDEVTAWRFGENFNLPLKTEFIDVTPSQNSLSFFSVNQPNVQITVVKSLADTVVRGEVSATPLDPQIKKVFVIRLQEFAGKSVTTNINLPVKIKSASIVNLTEDKVLQQVTQISPLTVQLKPFETKTVRFEIE